MFSFDEGKAALEFDDPTDFFAAGVFVREIGDFPVRFHQAVDEVIMRTAIFEVFDAAALGLSEAKFLLIGRHEEIRDGFGIGTGGRINVDVMHGSIRSTVAGSGNELTELAAEIGGSEMTGIQNAHFLPLARQEMASQRRPASAAGRAGYH
uniref:Uncharacterized protein n=1 Tax=Bosea sp. NBC_00436 TaxID=2969620 RepID=A0A9E7ZPV6_9HYPH